MTAPLTNRFDRRLGILDEIVAPVTIDRTAAAVAALAPEPLPETAGPPPTPPLPPAPPTTGGGDDNNEPAEPSYVAALRVVANRAAELNTSIRAAAAAGERLDSAIDILLAIAARDTNPDGSPT